jgi:hypothetical protein
MRFGITIVAVLMILGLAAFGVVSARLRFARRLGIATRAGPKNMMAKSKLQVPGP